MTVKELKQACGKGFSELTHAHGKSYAYGAVDEFNRVSSGESASDIEALTKLLHALNK